MIGFFRILIAIIRATYRFFNPPPVSHAFNATFVSEKSLLSKYHKGFCLTGKRRLTRKQSYQNAIVIGGTGTGKSSRILLPSLYTMSGSLVIHDPSGELYQKSAGYLHAKGYRIITLDFTSLPRSIGYNPLKRMKTPSDAQKLATTLIHTTMGRSGDQFWNLQAISLLSTLMQALKHQPLQLRTLRSVYALLQTMLAQPEKLLWFVRQQNLPEVEASSRAFMGFEEKLRTNIIATTMAALSHMQDETIAKITSVDTWDILSLRTRKTALYVQNPLTEQLYLSSLTSVFFEQLWTVVLSTLPQQQHHDVFFLIDEAASLFLPSLSMAIANVRKYRAGILLVLQNYNQLVHLYGHAQAETIRSNCFAQLYLSGQPLDTATELEHLLGKYEYQDTKEHKHVRPLMTRDEIRMMSSESSLLICGNHPPMRPKLTPYYQRRIWKKAAKISPPYQVSQVPQNLIYLTL